MKTTGENYWGKKLTKTERKLMTVLSHWTDSIFCKHSSEEFLLSVCLYCTSMWAIEYFTRTEIYLEQKIDRIVVSKKNETLTKSHGISQYFNDYFRNSHQ